MYKRFIITGGAGFIGSNFIRVMLNKYPQYTIYNIDKLTYAGSKDNLLDIENNPNYHFIKGDICDNFLMENLIQEGDVIVNFAAETHVDNSIKNAEEFVKSNILGVQNILDVARRKKAALFLQISTDEVYGSLKFDSKSSVESDVFEPSSPYSASKAAAEMLCKASIKTFNQPVIITRSSNNYGPYQLKEKLIPYFITRLLSGLKVPLYGEGLNVRDWIYVIDNCEAIDFVIHNGKLGEAYNIGGGNELHNIDVTKFLLEAFNLDESYIEHVQDRLGHDLRYSLDCSKINQLGWKPRFNFKETLNETINWYKQRYALEKNES